MRAKLTALVFLGACLATFTRWKAINGQVGAKDISLPNSATPVHDELVGKYAPEIQAARWFNAHGPVNLESLRGKIVLLEFWATYCPPCVAFSSHLSEIARQHAKNGLVTVALSDEPVERVKPFVEVNKPAYVVGAGSQSFDTYLVEQIPQVFLIDESGRIVWQGNPRGPELEKTISVLLARRPAKVDQP